MVTVQRVGVRYIIPDPPTSPSLISLDGFCGRKAQSFLSFPPFVSTFPVMPPNCWFRVLFSQNWTVIVTPRSQDHPRISEMNSRRCRMLLPGLLFDAVGSITSLLFSIPFIGFRYLVGFSTKSHLCVSAPFLTAIPAIYQNYCINISPLISFARLLTASALCANNRQKDFRRKVLLLHSPHRPYYSK